MKLSPLDGQHRELGGRMVAFAGWEMPVMYDSIISEHRAVREEVGVFDISHMGQIFITGEDAEAWLNRLLTNDVAALEDGQARYTFLLNEKGGVIDDLIAYRLEEEKYLLVVNAATICADLRWLQDHVDEKEEVEIVNESDEWAGLAVQGPKACEAYSAITGGRTLPSRNCVDDLEYEGKRFIVCRTGYTGEDGFELFCSKSNAGFWWGSLMDEEVKPCGLGARDSLRLEMCYPLNGSDLSPVRTPLEAGLGFFVDLEKEDFIGRKVLVGQKEKGCLERLSAIKVTERSAPPRPGYPVVSEGGAPLGKLTSGGMSPSLGEGIALAYLPCEFAKRGKNLFIEMRGKKIAAEVIKKPFYQK